MQKVFGALGGVLAGLLVVVLVRTVQFESRQVDAGQAPEASVDTNTAAERLAGALRFPTITHRDPADLDSAAYRDLHRYLAEAFPQVHRTLERSRVSDLSLLYRWPGRDTSAAPIVLMAHTDVVPVEAGTDTAWTHLPFGGTVAGGYVWGRGALDDKASALGMLEAAEALIESGYQPERTVYLALGHDEEVGGQRGARVMAERIASRGPNPELVVDEGGAITVGALPDVERPVALIGVAEKGYLSVELVAEGRGGHSAMPPEQTSVEVVSEAVARLGAHPLAAELDGVTGQTFRYIAPEMGWTRRAAFANLWLTEPLVTGLLARDPTTNAAIRTTTAPTVIDGGVKDNVIPSRARAVVNFRIVPSQRVDAVLEHVRRVVGDLPVTVQPLQNSEPTPVSAVDAEAFRVMQRTIQQVTPDVVITAPFLVPGTTDARYYAPYTNRVYRFVPFRLTPADRGRIHGTDERISLGDYATIVAFYQQLLRNMDTVE